MKTRDGRTLFCNAYVEDPDGLVLVVWNPIMHHWSLPGCEVQSGETPENAAARSLQRECGVGARSFLPLYQDDAGQDGYVLVYQAAIDGMPRTMREGADVRAMTHEVFLRHTPYPNFYARVLACARVRKLYCTVTLRRTSTGTWEREFHHTHGVDQTEARSAFEVGERDAIVRGDLKIVETAIVIGYKVADKQGKVLLA
jgi:ADP-ribose pyrophosphatase YjhB (NUDIX family)